MNFYLKNHAHSKTFLCVLTLCTAFLFTGCGSANTSGTQARTDLTAEHVRGLYSGMARTDIEDLLGVSDQSLAQKESIEVYGLADGTTAILRYHDDTLMGAYLRDEENTETPLFGYDTSNMTGINGIEETSGSINSTDAHPVPESDTHNHSNEDNTSSDTESAIDSLPDSTDESNSETTPTETH